MTSYIVNDVIRKNIYKFQNYVKTPEMIAVDIKGKINQINFNKWIWSVYQTIEMLSENDPIKFPTFLEAIYMILGVQNVHCTGQVDLYYNGVFFQGKQLVYDVPGQFEKFVNELKKRIEQGRCRFTTTYLGINGGTMDVRENHANVLFTFKENQCELCNDGKSCIYAGIYEPHGQIALNNKDTIEIADNFLNHLVKSDRFHKIEIQDISPYYGAQAFVSEKDIGYCTVISMFCVYNVLSIAKATRGNISLRDINSVEGVITYIFENFLPLKEHMRVFENFAFYLYQKYQGLLLEKSQVEFGKAFNSQLFANLIIDDLQEQVKRNLCSLKPIDPRSVKRRPETREEGKQLEKRVKRLANIPGEGLLYDKEICDIDDECMSQLCYDKKCIDINDCFENPKCKEEKLKPKERPFRNIRKNQKRGAAVKTK